MTVQEAIIGWLGGFEADGVLADIAVDQLPAGKAAGLFQTNRMTQLRFVDGSRDVTQGYELLIRFDNTGDDARMQGRLLLQALQEWICEKDLAGSLPYLSGRRVCHGVAAAGGDMQFNGLEAVLHIGIEISYYES